MLNNGQPTCKYYLYASRWVFCGRARLPVFVNEIELRTTDALEISFTNFFSLIPSQRLVLLMLGLV